MSKIDLTTLTGLPISFDGRKLWFDAELGTIDHSQRTVSQMEQVAANPEQIIQPKDTALYYVYRDVALPQDRVQLAKHHLRYDITHIPPATLSSELVKTFGHYHPKDWPELYQVIQGEAWYLLQKKDEANPKIITDCYLAQVKTGQKIIIPPYFGHLMVNPGKKDLITANLVSSQFTHDYSQYGQLRGGAYYCLADGNILKNSRYEQVKKLEIIEPNKESKLLIKSDQRPIYQWAIGDIKAMEFLNTPKEFSWDLKDLFKTFE